MTNQEFQASYLPPQEDEFSRLRVGDSWVKQSQTEFLERYVTNTDGLIGAIQHFDRDEDGEEHPADYVMYLDKSARPVAWMTRELWPMLAEPDTTGDVPAMPEMRFINIDRLPWRVDPTVEITRNPANFRQPTNEDIRGIRSIFALPGTSPEDENPLDGRRILIVDEVSDSGDTTYVATELLRRAFPGAETRVYNWMNDYHFARDGEKVVDDRPVWYQAEEESGRGVFGQVGEGTVSANTKSNLSPGAHQFLSTRPRIPIITQEGDVQIASVDARGTELRDDIKKMAQLLKERKLYPIPDHSHESQYNGMPIDEYAVVRRAMLERRAADNKKPLVSN